MLKIGDEVYLSDEGIKRWRGFGAESSNPISTKGVITGIEITDGEIDNLGFFVNGYCNSYDQENLIKVTQEKPVVIGYKQIGHKGVKWDDDEFPLMSEKEMKFESEFDLKCGFTKAKFRPVYEVKK